jgi:hypothetical protein
VRRWFLYRLRGENQDGKEREEAEKFFFWCGAFKKRTSKSEQKPSTNAIKMLLY